MRKRNIILLILGLFLIAGFLGYKSFILYYYNLKNTSIQYYSDFIKGLEKKKKIVIENDQSTTNYLEYNNVKIRNDFEKFTKIEENNNLINSVKYSLQNDSEKAFFAISIENIYTNLLKIDSSSLPPDNKKYKTPDMAKIFINNNINNEKDLYNYLLNYIPKKNNIFTSTSKIKEDFIIQCILYSILPNANYITEISGYYDGYIYGNPNYKDVVIIKEDKSYHFSFFVLDYFTDDYIEELIKTIVIE